MTFTTRVVATLVATAAALPVAAEGRTDPIKLGVLTDMTGAYSNAVGPGSVIAAQMAIDDFGGKARGLPIELISADMLNKVDVSTAIAREWVESDGVDVIIDVPISSGSLAVNDIVADNDAILFSAAGSNEMSGAACKGHTVQWIWDNYAMASALTNALMDEGGDKWFYITVDYTFGHDLENMSSKMVKDAGNEVVGAIRQPWGTVDQSSAVFEIAASDANVVGLANGGTDTVNSIKQLKEFGVGPESGKKIAAFVMGQADIKAVGLDQTQGLYVPMPFYWDLNDQTRAFSERFMEKSGGTPPSYQQAGVYSEITHYLKALEDAPSSGGADVLATMRSMLIDDDLFGKGELRIDGRRTHPMYLLQVKSPAESSGDWDFLKVTSEIPADKVVQPLNETGCTLVKSN